MVNSVRLKKRALKWRQHRRLTKFAEAQSTLFKSKICSRYPFSGRLYYYAKDMKYVSRVTLAGNLYNHQEGELW